MMCGGYDATLATAHRSCGLLRVSTIVQLNGRNVTNGLVGTTSEHARTAKIRASSGKKGNKKIKHTLAIHIMWSWRKIGARKWETFWLWKMFLAWCTHFIRSCCVYAWCRARECHVCSNQKWTKENEKKNNLCVVSMTRWRRQRHVMASRISALLPMLMHSSQASDNGT